MKTVKQLEQSQRMRLDNVKNMRMPAVARAMYLDGKVKLCRANITAHSANSGKGWVSILTQTPDVPEEVVT